MKKKKKKKVMNLIDIKDVLDTDLKGQVSVKSISNLKLWLDSDKKIKLFEKYVKNMNNDCLTLDCLSYKQLVLDNRRMDLESVKRQLKEWMKKEDYINIHNLLRNLLLENLEIEQTKEFIKRSKDIQFVELFIEYWIDRKGIPFDNLMKMYDNFNKNNKQYIIA